MDKEAKKIISLSLLPLLSTSTPPDSPLFSVVFTSPIPLLSLALLSSPSLARIQIPPFPAMVQIRAMVTRPAASIPMSSPKTPSTRDIKSSAAATEQQSAPPRHAVKPGCPPGLNKYSSKITQPKSQGASQAMLYATGLSEEDMNKPQVKRWPIGKEEEEKFDR